MGTEPQPKDFRDAFPAEAWKAVKLAIRQTVARAGGVEAVAAVFKSTKLNAGRVTEWQSMRDEHLTTMPNLWQIGQIEAFAGVSWITEAMAALHGSDLVHRPTTKDGVALCTQSLGRFVSATGAAMGDIGASLKDGRVSIAEARKIRNQLLEVQRVAMQWLSDLDHMLDDLTPSN